MPTRDDPEYHFRATLSLNDPFHLFFIICILCPLDNIFAKPSLQEFLNPMRGVFTQKHSNTRWQFSITIKIAKVQSCFANLAIVWSTAPLTCDHVYHKHFLYSSEKPQPKITFFFFFRGGGILTQRIDPLVLYFLGTFLSFFSKPFKQHFQQCNGDFDNDSD